MRQRFGVVLGAVALLLAACVATVAGSTSAPDGDGPARSRQVVERVDDASVPVARALDRVDRLERARPVLLGALLAALLLAIVGWVRTLEVQRAMVPVRVHERRQAPVRGPPGRGTSHR
jgi:hypothetical protein